MKFLDLESGRLLEVGAYSRLGAYYNLTIFSISNFILQQNVKMFPMFQIRILTVHWNFLLLVEVYSRLGTY